jgi:putative spermidine/putrescine transport system permease protein
MVANRLRVIGLLLPGFFLIVAVFVAPSLELLRYSFYKHIPGGGLQPALVLENYSRLVIDPYYASVLLRTVGLALEVTGLTILLGYPLAYWLVGLPARTRAMVLGLTVLPLMTSVVVRTFGWFVILGETGVVNQILLKVGLVSHPLRIMFTDRATIIGLTHILLPFMVLSVNSVLENLDPSLREAARNLGANPSRTFLRITLPLSLSGVATGALLVFVLTMSSFVTPTLLGGPSGKVLASLIFEQGLTLLNWPFAAALAFVLLAISSVALGAYYRLLSAAPR